MDRWIYGWIVGWVHGWMDESMYGWIQLGDLALALQQMEKNTPIH